ncbi:MAG: ABC transporter permease [Elusimicrobia bacterium]|nr:ABC transporter permease [Elusimicrobiota bacterium]
MNGIYAILLREVKIFFREKERIISILVSPLLFLFVIGRSIGTGANPVRDTPVEVAIKNAENIQIIEGQTKDSLQSTVVQARPISNGASPVQGYTYQQFIFPGILVMVCLFTSITYGLYIIWDKRLDFLKEVLVAPISRTSLFMGKSIGGITGAMIEVVIVLLIGYFFILPVPLWKFLLCVLWLIPVSYMVANIGLSIGARMKSMEGFGLVMSFLTWPMFFFSGALFEISGTSPVIKTISFFDPMTYAVDMVRRILLGYGNFSAYTNITAVGFFAVLTTFIGIKFFGELQQTK